MPAWTSSTRRDRLPADWDKTRKRILRRDKGACQVVMDDGKVCGDIANEVDHIKAGDDHSDQNLQAICRWHHKKKSSSEGNAALRAKRKKISKSFRRTEEHPGLM